MAVERTPSGSSLIDVLDRVLDKGIVIDAWVRVSLVGIDLVTVEARIVVASIDTYLKYSEAEGIAVRHHPVMIAALAITPVVRESPRVARIGRFGPIHEWTALPMPQPHYRGAPALLADSHAAAMLGETGARLVPLRERAFNTAPGGVLLLAVAMDDQTARDLADITMMAGSILARVASMEWWKDQSDRLNRERDRLTLMVDSLPDAVVIT